MIKNQKKAYYYGLAAILFWSTIATAFSLALKQSSVLMLMLGASLVAVISLSIILAIRGDLSRLLHQSPTQWLHSALMGFINPFLYYLLLLQAYATLPAQEALVLNYIWPISLILLSIPILKQKIRAKSFLFILISFMGVIIIATRGQLLELRFTNLKGDLYAVLSSVAWALYWIFNLKDTREEALKLLMNFLFGIIYIGIALLISGSFEIPGWKGLAAIAWIGLFELGITFYFWLKALSLSERTDTISGLVYLSPFISLLLIAIVLKESIQISTLIGLLFIIGGILLNSRWGKEKSGTGNLKDV